MLRDQRAEGLERSEGPKVLNEAERSKGFTLLEVLIAMFFITVGATAAFVLVQRVATFSLGASQKLQASYLAQEGVEIVRNMRDSNSVKTSKGQTTPWSTGLISCSAGCQADYASASLSPYTGSFLLWNGSFYSYATGEKTIFQRRITIRMINENLMYIDSEVFWNDRGVSKSVDVSSRFVNWFTPFL